MDGRDADFELNWIGDGIVLTTVAWSGPIGNVTP